MSDVLIDNVQAARIEEGLEILSADIRQFLPAAACKDLGALIELLGLFSRESNNVESVKNTEGKSIRRPTWQNIKEKLSSLYNELDPWQFDERKQLRKFMNYVTLPTREQYQILLNSEAEAIFREVEQAVKYPLQKKMKLLLERFAKDYVQYVPDELEQEFLRKETRKVSIGEIEDLFGTLSKSLSTLGRRSLKKSVEGLAHEINPDKSPGHGRF